MRSDAGRARHELRSVESAVGACRDVAAPFAPLLGSSDAMRDVRRRLAAAATTRSTVLLSGETGTGKGLAARLLHSAGFPAGAPFVHVDCASLAANLIESELFGHERGAFTGASQRRIGRFELAAGGTLFLDEIGELAAPLQAKLLRVLQDREFERIGGTQTLPMTARIVAATNRDLGRAVRQRRFRADLYHRLKVVHVRAPALREREADVPLLIENALDNLCPRLRCPRPHVTADFLEALVGYSWPGNVRELANSVERLLVFAAESWRAEHAADLREDDTNSQLWLDLGEAREEELERQRVATALAHHGGNVARAARSLNVPRSTLRYRIAKYRL